MSGDPLMALPFGILVAGAFIVYVASRGFRLRSRETALLCILFLCLTLAALLHLINLELSDPPGTGGRTLAWGGITLQISPLGMYIAIVSIGVALLACLYSAESLSRNPRHLVLYPLILVTLAGQMGMFFTQDLFNLFLFVELTTITVSVMVAFRFQREGSVWAGYKYLVMSSLATMIMLLGIYFVYRGSGHITIGVSSSDTGLFSRLGAVCFLIGLSLKAGIVPLHTWVPDVYSRAPNAVIAFLAGAFSKSIIFVFPFICLRLGLTSNEVGLYLIVFAMINMLLGSARALNQQSLQRFLAYSSIAQTGYLMFSLGIGIYYRLPEALAASLVLFTVIAVSKSLAFFSVGVYEHHLYTDDSKILRGIHKKYRLVALCLSVALAGMAGIPLLAGFIGKWLVYTATLSTGDPWAVAGLGVFLVSTVIGLGGYLPVLANQYRQPIPGIPQPKTQLSDVVPSTWMHMSIALLAVLVLIIGVFPQPLISIVERLSKWMIL